SGSPAQRPRDMMIVPASKWVILDDYKLKKQAFAIGEEHDLNVILGNAHLDLNRGFIDAENINLSIMTVLGDVKLNLPEDWSADVKMHTLVGDIKVLGHQES